MGLLSKFSGSSQPDIDSLAKKQDIEGLFSALYKLKPYPPRPSIDEQTAIYLQNESYVSKIRESLLQIGEPAAIKIIENLKDQRWGRTGPASGHCHWEYIPRSFALHLLGMIKHPLAFEALKEELNSDEALFRELAAISLGKLGDRRSIPDLSQALKDKDKGVRSCAAHSLGELAASEASDALYEAVTDPNDLVRHNIVRALCQIKDERVKPSLIQILSETIDRNSLEFAEHLMVLGEKSAVYPFIARLLDFEHIMSSDFSPYLKIRGPLYSFEREVMTRSALANFHNTILNAMVVINRLPPEYRPFNDLLSVKDGLLKMSDDFSEDKFLQRLEDVFSAGLKNIIKDRCDRIKRICSFFP
jgi:hypothetical protein